MSCKAALDGWYAKQRGTNGKRAVVFHQADGLSNRPVSVPCGRCIGCRLEYSRNWAIRCMHESTMHKENAFVTLTYDDEHLPDGGTLVKRDAQLFMKRLRSRFDDRRIRFFLSGEYGAETFRPHYHCLLFGFDFPDKRVYCHREGYTVWTSDLLEQTWTNGLSEIGSVTFESAAYCARYMVQKFKGKKAVVEKYYDGLEQEFALMSRRPGIGKSYYEKHGTEIYQHDSVIMSGKEVRPPRYYDQLFEAASPLKSACVRAKRIARAKKMVEKDGRGDSRLLAEQEILEAQTNLYGGEL